VDVKSFQKKQKTFKNVDKKPSALRENYSIAIQPCSHKTKYLFKNIQLVWHCIA